MTETASGNPFSPATWTYHAPATVGADSFTFSATDNHGATSTPVTVSIVVHDEAYTTAPHCFGNETDVRTDGKRQLYLSCSDDEHDPMTVSVDQTGLRGTLTQPSESDMPPGPNVWTYTAPATAGADSFHFSATDDHGATSTPGTMNIAVHDQTYNTAPTCYGNGFPALSVETGATVTLGVPCSDAEGDALTPVVTTPPAHGTLTAHKYTYGSYTYSYLEYESTDDAFTGQDSFAFKVTDVPPSGATPMVSAIVTSSVTVTPPQPPTCYQPPAVTLRAGKNRGLGLACWSQNPANQGQLTFDITRSPAHGTLTTPGGENSGYVVYTPAPGWSGTDSFSYTAANASGTSNEVTQELTVSAAYNATPQCYANVPWGSIRSGVAKQLFLTCWDEDGDALSYTIVHGPAHGTLGTLHQPGSSFESGSLTYTSSAGWSGTDSIEFKASDGHADSDVTTMSFEVDSAQTNTAPQCWDGSSLRVAANGSIEFGAGMLPCWDADDDQLSYTVVTPPTHGALSAPNVDGFRSYTPTNTAWTGDDTFTIKANDGRADSDPVPVKLTVTAATEFVTAPVTLPSGQPARVQTFVDDAGKSTVSVTSGDVAQFPNHCMPLDVATDIASGTGSVSNVTLTLDPTLGADQTFVMSNGGSGDHWTATVPCVASGDLTVTWDFTEGTTQTFSRPLGGIVLIDPSGVVHDKARYDAAIAAGETADEARTIAAIAGATVRLQRKTSGVWANVLSGDPGISPNINPEVTKADGLYQWDVSAGVYRVVVTRVGYVMQTSSEVDIPPAVTDLHIAMVRNPAAPSPGDDIPPPTDDPDPVDPGPGDPPGPTGPVVTPPPTPTTPTGTTPTAPVSCVDLATSKRAACEQARKLDAALAKCSKLRGATKTTCANKAKAVAKLDAALGKCSKLRGAKKSTCASQAKALSKCESLKGSRKVACVKKANAIGRKR